MHRKIMGCGNAHLDEVNYNKNKKIHLERVLKARLTGDPKLFQTMYDHQFLGQNEYRFRNTINNAKTIQMRNERYDEIERVNRLLYNQMTTRRNRESNNHSPNLDMLGNQITYNRMSERRRQLRQIEEQNHNFLKRL